MIVREVDIRRRIDTTLGDECGAAIVEFAIIFPVLIVLLFGMIDFGRAFFIRNNLVAAVREGARVGSVQLLPPCVVANQARMVNRTKEYITGIGGDSAGSAVRVEIPVGNCTTGVTDVRVRVENYQFTPITPVFRLISFNANLLRINVSATYRWESSGP